MVIFFDLDDTLIDSQGAVLAAIYELYATPHIEGALEDFARLWRNAHARYYHRYLEGALAYDELRRFRIQHVLGRNLVTMRRTLFSRPAAPHTKKGGPFSRM